VIAMTRPGDSWSDGSGEWLIKLLSKKSILTLFVIDLERGKVVLWLRSLT
jgi:hypothetical protein